MHNPKCFNSHMGAWLMDADRLQEKLDLIRSGHIKAAEAPDAGAQDAIPKLHINNGVALIEINDVMMRKQSKYGGCSTIGVRALLREAVLDPSVSKIALIVNSPGGNVDGQEELVNDIRLAGVFKPVIGHATMIAASAAFWALAACTESYATKMTMLGSIGAVAVLRDTSKMHEMAGIKVIPVRSGKNKGLGVPGTEIDDDTIAKVQAEVDGFAKFFIDDVKASRPKWDGSKADGSCMFAEEALRMGLIDGICTLDECIEMLSKGQSMKDSVTRKVVAEEPAKPVGEDTVVNVDAIKDVDEQVKVESEVDVESLIKANKDLAEELAASRSGIAADQQKIAKLEAAVKELPNTVAKSIQDEVLKMAASAGIATEGREYEKVKLQFESLLKFGGKPVGKDGKTVASTDPAVVLAEYHKQYGTTAGGVRFKREHPALFDALNKRINELKK